MADFLSFLGGAAGAYANIANEDRKRREIEAYNERLRQQELEDYEQKLRVQQRLNQGQPLGNPTLNPMTGQYMGLVYGAPGEAPQMQTFGDPMPGVREAYLAEQEFEAAKRQADLEFAQGRITNQEYDRRLKEASIADKQAGAALKRDRVENPERHRGTSVPVDNPRTAAFVEDRAIANEAAAAGLLYNPRSRMITDPATESPVSAEQRGSIISQATKGRSPTNPVDVTSEAEADRLPKGTYIRFRGRIGVVE